MRFALACTTNGYATQTQRIKYDHKHDQASPYIQRSPRALAGPRTRPRRRCCVWRHSECHPPPPPGSGRSHRRRGRQQPALRTTRRRRHDVPGERHLRQREVHHGVRRQLLMDRDVRGPRDLRYRRRVHHRWGLLAGGLAYRVFGRWGEDQCLVDWNANYGTSCTKRVYAQTYNFKDAFCARAASTRRAALATARRRTPSPCRCTPASNSRSQYGCRTMTTRAPMTTRAAPPTGSVHIRPHSSSEDVHHRRSEQGAHDALQRHRGMLGRIPPLVSPNACDVRPGATCAAPGPRLLPG
jgi:hypothetical protein